MDNKYYSKALKKIFVNDNEEKSFNVIDRVREAGGSLFQTTSIIQALCVTVWRLKVNQDAIIATQVNRIEQLEDFVSSCQNDFNDIKSRLDDAESEVNDIDDKVDREVSSQIEELDMNSIAENIDLDDLAKHVDVDYDDLSDHLDLKQLSESVEKGASKIGTEQVAKYLTKEVIEKFRNDPSALWKLIGHVMQDKKDTENDI